MYTGKMAQVAGFDWDDGNRTKCRKHGVSIEEIESVFDSTIIVIPDAAHSASEPRMRAIGRAASGRHVFVVFTIRIQGSRELIRPISARYMHRKEVERHEEANPQAEEDTNVQDG
jgi:hypothetical protein